MLLWKLVGRRGIGCFYLKIKRRLKVTSENALGKLYPDLAKERHPKNNGACAETGPTFKTKKRKVRVLYPIRRCFFIGTSQDRPLDRRSSCIFLAVPPDPLSNHPAAFHPQNHQPSTEYHNSKHE